MKTKYSIIAVLVMFLASACSDYLDVPNQGNLANNSFWQTEQHVQQGLTAAYSALASHDGSKWTFFEEVFLGLVIRTDETANNPASGYASKLASFTNTADESTALNNWLTRYAGIARANQVIQNTPSVPGLSDAMKKSCIAEAKFLRAINYFYLVCSFENVPKITTFETELDKMLQPQVAASEIWTLIESDLKEAEANLPDARPEEWTGRATRWSAKALLGKSYLFQEKWSDAVFIFKEVVDNGPYKLLPNYADNFNGVGENGTESIVEIQFSGNRNGGIDKRQPINWEITPMGLDGWELFSASDWILSEMKTDLTLTGKYSDRVYASLFFDDPNSTMRKPTGTEEITYADVKAKGLTFPQYFKKFNAWTDRQGDYVGTNVSLIRFADVLLMYAEALNENGSTAPAIDIINTVRTRSHAAPLDYVFTKDQLRTQIRHHERPCELSMEYGIRWMDLYRWHKGSVAQESIKATLSNHAKEFADKFTEGKHEISPIPASEIPLGKLKQNDNW